jgi:hypothetical protein
MRILNTSDTLGCVGYGDTLIEEDLVCGRLLFVLKLTNNWKILLVKFTVLC